METAIEMETENGEWRLELRWRQRMENEDNGDGGDEDGGDVEGEDDIEKETKTDTRTYLCEPAPIDDLLACRSPGEAVSAAVEEEIQLAKVLQGQ